MNPYDRVTIIRNRARARDLRIFRARVRAYFEQFEYDLEELPVDWQGVQATRAEINRMLPRVVQIVHAADLGASASSNPASRAVEILQSIFSSRYAHGGHQEVFDVIDMAVGVYDANQYAAWMRTINPLHYVLSVLGWIAGLPRRSLIAIGLITPRSAHVRTDSVGRLEAALSRLTGIEELIENRFAEMREWQSRLFADQADRLADVAERMDFVERVLAQQRPPHQLDPAKKKESTPV